MCPCIPGPAFFPPPVLLCPVSTHSPFSGAPVTCSFDHKDSGAGSGSDSWTEALLCVCSPSSRRTGASWASEESELGCPGQGSSV